MALVCSKSARVSEPGRISLVLAFVGRTMVGLRAFSPTGFLFGVHSRLSGLVWSSVLCCGL